MENEKVRQGQIYT